MTGGLCVNCPLLFGVVMMLFLGNSFLLTCLKFVKIVR